MQTRVHWIDWAKVLGIGLVVFGHLPDGDPAAVSFVFTFHMPLFFFVSGFLVKPKPLLETTKVGVSRLLVPYVLFYLVSWVWWFWATYQRHPEVFPPTQMLNQAFVRPVLGLLFGVGYNTSASSMLDIPLWFLVSLFSLGIFFTVLSRLKSRAVVFLLSCLLAVVPVVLSSLGVDLLLSLDSSLMALPFYVVGKYAADAYNTPRVSEFLKKRGLAISIPTFVVALLVVLAITALNGRVDVNHVNYGASPLLFYVGGFAGILLMWSLSEILSGVHHGPILATISNGSIVILALHLIPSALLSVGIHFFNLDYGLLERILVSTAVVLVFVPLIGFLERYAPVFVGNRRSRTS